MVPIQELFWFITVLAIAGAVAGFLAGMFGIGGGAILVPVLYQAFTLLDTSDQVRMHLSVGTSLAVIVPTSISSFRAHYKRKAPDMALLKSWVIVVPLGVIVASIIVAEASSSVLRGVFAVIAVLVGIRMILNRDSWRLADDLPKNPLRAICGFVIGLLSALMGVGGGVLNNTFMTSFGRPVHQAVATSSGLGILISWPGLIGYIWAGWGNPDLPIYSTGYVNWIAVVLTIPITLLMAPLGANAAHALNRRQLETAFGVFMIVVAGRFFWSLI
ncbi:sulfite exporter TauE/SafE family protein [Hoeflea sp. TYP-13]|uniref:sulfite exporter TauE/SafE family protein n=1 Tax=Hoeflea sp. TYP-13 TaxID=3230023 RepID=UPI0034C67C9B